MRVFYAAPDHGWEEANLLAGLRQAGADVVTFDLGVTMYDTSGPDWTFSRRGALSERLVAAVVDEHTRAPLDLFFSYFRSAYVNPEAIRSITDLGIVTVNYWVNGLHQFDLVEEISPSYAFCAASERDALPRYSSVGARPVYMQMAANPDLYRPYALPLEFDVTFVGQRYSDRPEYLSFLLRHGVDVRVWGPGWTQDRRYGERVVPNAFTERLRHPVRSARRLLGRTGRRVARLRDLSPLDELRLARVAGPSLPFDELVKMYSRSRVSLGFSTIGNARYRDRDKQRQLHLRDFEAPMSGALYLVEHMAELEDFFAIGREIDTYRHREELLEKVRFYLDRPDHAARVRACGLERARRDHTWAVRFRQLFTDVGLAPLGALAPR